MDNLDLNMTRFDIHCRSEEFFSATLLSYLFINNNFEGIRTFFNLLKTSNIQLENNLIFSENNIISLCHNFDPKLVHYGTEVNLFRDFAYHDISLNPKAYDKKIKESTPDIIFVYKNYAFIIECKVYTNYSSISLSKQLDDQKYIFDMLKYFYNNDNLNCVHIAVIPDKLTLKSGNVITWKEIITYYKKTIDENNYLKTIFQNNIDHLYKNYQHF